MRCTFPRTVGFQDDGKTISWSQKNFSKEFATFQLPCGKCIECRLEYARQWAIRCVHESQMHPDNSFVTLTYSDENLKSPKLKYEDFQLFMKRLRFTYPNNTISYFVTGEYGEKTKRPHWHAIIFGYSPKDSTLKYTSARGDKVYESESLTKTWGHGIAEFGSVTFQSAGYCARYAAKKLVHGSDQEHDFHPISKKSSKHAIGKKWLEKNWQDIFNYGECILPDGTSSSIPRYYEKWMKEHHPQEWLTYLENVKLKKITRAQQKAEKEVNDYQFDVIQRNFTHRLNPITPNQRRRKLSEARFKTLQNNLKL